MNITSDHVTGFVVGLGVASLGFYMYKKNEAQIDERPRGQSINFPFRAFKPKTRPAVARRIASRGRKAGRLDRRARDGREVDDAGLAGARVSFAALPLDPACASGAVLRTIAGDGSLVLFRTACRFLRRGATNRSGRKNRLAKNVEKAAFARENLGRRCFEGRYNLPRVCIGPFNNRSIWSLLGVVGERLGPVKQ